MSAEWGYTVEYVAGLIRGNYTSTLYKTTFTSLSTVRNAHLHTVKEQQNVCPIRILCVYNIIRRMCAKQSTPTHTVHTLM